MCATPLAGRGKKGQEKRFEARKKSVKHSNAEEIQPREHGSLPGKRKGAADQKLGRIKRSMKQASKNAKRYSGNRTKRLNSKFAI